MTDPAKTGDGPRFPAGFRDLMKTSYTLPPIAEPYACRSDGNRNPSDVGRVLSEIRKQKKIAEAIAEEDGVKAASVREDRGLTEYIDVLFLAGAPYVNVMALLLCRSFFREGSREQRLPDGSDRRLIRNKLNPRSLQYQVRRGISYIRRFVIL